MSIKDRVGNADLKNKAGIAKQGSLVSYFKPKQNKKRDSDEDEVASSKAKVTRMNTEFEKEMSSLGALKKAERLLKVDTVLRAELALIPDAWFDLLYDEMCKPYFRKIIQYVNEERARYNVYPPRELVYNCLNYDYKSTKVIIIGQDPYHGPGQAHGLCFSVSKYIRPPPSLLNIFQEIENNIGKDKFKRPNHGCLTGWRDQGVLLLNDSLTVREGSPLSHSNIGWSEFTNFIVCHLAKTVPFLVFMLWGGSAQAKLKKIYPPINFNSNHLILTSKHPSPLSANQGGWFGNKNFSKANEFLKKNNRSEIDWGYLP